MGFESIFSPAAGQPLFPLMVSVALILLCLLLLLVLYRRGRRLALQDGELLILQERLRGREEETVSLRQEREAFLTQAREGSEMLSRYRERISALQTELDQERQQNAEKLELLRGAREQMSLEFRTLAGEILEDKSRRFTQSNREGMAELLGPLNSKIRDFEKKVEETYEREARERFSLAREIRGLQELNARISTEAANLTQALKGDNKVQGSWGEVILESILEQSGLVQGREYERQLSLKGSDGARAQPDVVVRLPGQKDVIIDAKVSLTAYEGYCSEEDESVRADCLRQHLQSVHGHIRLLSGKEYQNLLELNSLDFVLLFMPIEAAFSLALQEDPGLFASAFDRNIIVVGPSTLLATLRTIQNTWRYEQQSRNAKEIARRAGSLYDKFVAFVGDLEEVGERLGAAQRAYERGYSKLSSGRGNLISRVEKLKDLGARTSKQQKAELLELAGETEDNAE